MQHNNIIFDFDGTLCDSKDQVVAIYNQMAAKHRFRKIDHSNLQQVSGMSPWQAATFLKVPFYKIPILLSEGRKLAKISQVALKPVEGLDQVLAQLHNRGFNIYLYSTNSKQHIESVLPSVLKFNQFKEIAGGSSLWKHSGLIKLIKKHQLDKNSTWYVGDEIRDVISGQKAGIKTIAVAWGLNSTASLTAAQPNGLAKTPEDLTNSLKFV
jgi:phosphoglycolate phosphatase